MINQSPEKIQKLFDEIAPGYDFMNNIISFGQHYPIKKSAINKLFLPDNARVLDLCCGTGDITKILAQKKSVKSVVGVDFSHKMLEIASKKNSNKKIEYIFADCTKLPFEDNSFDAVTMCFGLRNIEDKKSVIKEIHRVLKSGGVFWHMDFGKENPFADFIFDFCTPVFAKIFFIQEPYKYLINSKKDFFNPKELEDFVLSVGFELIKNDYFLLKSISAQSFKKF